MLSNVSVYDTEAIKPTTKQVYSMLRPTHLAARLALLSLSINFAFADTQPIDRIEVTGFIAGANHDDSNTRSYDHDFLARFGDDDLQSALRRIPGVTIDMTPGPGLDDPKISLRGMGNGYTRVTIDDQPIGTLGSGVSLADIPIELIERIEVRNGGDARDSGEAVAGTINIVMRESLKNGNTLRVGGAVSAGRFGPQIGTEYRNSDGPWSWQLVTSLKRTPSQRDRDIYSRIDDIWGDPPELISHEHWQQRPLDETAMLLPSLRWRQGGDQISVKWLMDYSHWTAPGYNDIPSYQAAYPAYYASAVTRDASLSMNHMLSTNWTHKLVGGGQFTLEAVFHQEHDRDDSTWFGTDPTGAPLDPQTELDHQLEKQQNLRLGWSVPIVPGIQARWGAELQHDHDDNDSFSFGDSNVSTSSSWRRQLAFYGQGSWQATPSLDITVECP